MKFPYRTEPSTPSAAHPACTSVLRSRIRIRLPLDPNNPNRYGGIGSGHITAFFTQVTVDVVGVSFPLYAGFSDAPSSLWDLNGFDFRYNTRYLADVTCHS